MMSFHWPGNLRELHNAADRFVLGLSDEEWVAAVVRDYQRVGCAWTLMFVVNDFERLLLQRPWSLQAGARKTHQLRYLSEEMLCRRWPIKSGILSVPHSDWTAKK
jgi:DNA-binding NtrC family response regulator